MNETAKNENGAFSVVLVATKTKIAAEKNAQLKKEIAAQKRKNEASEARILAYIEENAALKAAISAIE